MSLPPDTHFKYEEQIAPIESKKTLRKALLETRKNITTETRFRFDAEIGQHVLHYLYSNAFKTVGVYLPIRGEPNLLALYEALSPKMPLSLPIVVSGDQPLQFVRWKPGDPLVEGAYKVPVPKRQDAVDVPDALLIPCVGFTASRFRLGYGGGFFDRTLAKYPNIHTIGIAYSCLLTDFATEKTDISLQCIITETGIML